MTTSPHTKDHRNHASEAATAPGANPQQSRVVNHFHVGPDQSSQNSLQSQEGIAARSKSTCAPYSPYLKVLQEEQQRLQKTPVLETEGTETESDSEVLNAKFERDLEMREKLSKDSSSASSMSSSTTTDAAEDEPDDKKFTKTVKKNGILEKKTSPIQKQDSVEGSPANRRWLILIEPINALHIDVILGAKVRINTSLNNHL